MFFVIPDRAHQLGLVQSVRPGGKVDRLYDCGKLIVTAYVVPGGQ